jgi:hypothetical protein
MRIVANKSSTEEPATGTLAVVVGFVVDTPATGAVVVDETWVGDAAVVVAVTEAFGAHSATSRRRRATSAESAARPNATFTEIHFAM